MALGFVTALGSPVPGSIAETATAKTSVREIWGMPAASAPSRSESLADLPIVCTPREERIRLEAEMRVLCGDHFNGELDKAWKQFQEKLARKNELAPGDLPDCSAQDVDTIYLKLETSRKKIEKRLKSLTSFINALENPSIPLSAGALEFAQVFSEYHKVELSAASGTRADELRLLVENLDLIIREPGTRNCIASTVIDKIKEAVNNNKAHLEKNLSIMNGSADNGKIEEACRIFEALEAKERYEALEKRRQQIERLLALPEKASAVVSRALAELPPVRGVVAAGGAGASAGASSTLTIPGSPVGGSGAIPSYASPTGSTITPSVSVKKLIDEFSPYWNGEKERFNEIPFDEGAFKELLRTHNAKFPPTHNTATDYGCIEVKTVKPKTKIFVRADLHGDLKSLLENLKGIQAQGLLDDSFHCKDGVQLVFLGDYEDRGQCSLQVLQLLLTLRMENPSSVTLIRGNHESSMLNGMYCGYDDKSFKQFLFKTDTEGNPLEPKEENRKLLESTYDTLTLALFMGEKAESRQVQYTMFTHGLFELYADPQECLRAQPEHAVITIPKVSKDSPPSSLLSARVKALPFDEAKNYPTLLKEASKPERKALKAEYAAQRVHTLAKKDTTRSSSFGYYCADSSLTAFNWGDMPGAEALGSFPTMLEDMGARRWIMTPDDVKHYLRAISTSPTSDEEPSAKVKLVFRGHQHQVQHYTTAKGKLVATTLPVGMENESYKRLFSGQDDTAYVLETGPKVNAWKKLVMTRKPGTSDTIVGPAEKLVPDLSK